MPLTKAEHSDLTTRLEVLVGEYAAASDRRQATEKLHDVLAHVPIEPDAPVAEAAPEPVTEPATEPATTE